MEIQLCRPRGLKKEGLKKYSKGTEENECGGNGEGGEVRSTDTSYGENGCLVVLGQV